MDRDMFGGRLEAVKSYIVGDRCRLAAEAIEAVRTAQRAVQTLADARGFRGDMIAVHGADAGVGVLEDWRAAAYNLATVAGILDSTATPAKA